MNKQQATLAHFVSAQQLQAIRALAKGEEAAFFANALTELQQTIDTMPLVYEQDGKGDETVAFLHYFKGGFDWYITERDFTDEQYQAFGLVSGQCLELGYVSIIELMSVGAEIDLHWTPKTLGEIKANR